MTKKEIENDAAEYLKTLTPDGWDDFENQPTYNAVQLVKAIYHGYEQGYEDCRHYAHDYYKSKYHDLKKNPNDLPDTNREVLVLLWDYDNYYIGRYEEEYDDVIRENTYWHFSDFSIEKDKLDTVLGWFELPKVKR